jgi:pimeloyl-ACP methyl ester carboxylesterase
VIHGGFWKPQYDASLMDGVCADLRERGWDAVNVEYRRGQGWPAMRDDVLAAYDATPADAAIGHSAGGQLAVWLAAHRPLRAVVSQAGVLDLARASELRLSDGIVERVFAPDEIAAASPIELEIAARVLCVHGSADTDVPLEISERFAERRGAELRVFAGEDHYGHIDPAHPMWRCAADWLDALTG